MKNLHLIFALFIAAFCVGSIVASDLPKNKSQKKEKNQKKKREKKPKWQHTCMVPYAGVHYIPSGYVEIKHMNNYKFHFWYSFQGLPKFVIGKIAITDGPSCDHPGDPKYNPHFYSPWEHVRYYSDYYGNASGRYKKLVAGTDYFDTLGSPVVVYSADGKKMACGMLKAGKHTRCPYYPPPSQPIYPKPTNKPTAKPTTNPTSHPTVWPRYFWPNPTMKPTSKPTDWPMNWPKPTSSPTPKPTDWPVNWPKPTMKPTSHPTKKPTNKPTPKPTYWPQGWAKPSPSPTPKPTSWPQNWSGAYAP